MTMLSLSRYHATWHRWARFVAQRVVLRSVVRSVTRVTVEGARNVDGLAGPFVVVANHTSHLDAALMVSHLPRRVTAHLAVAAAADYFYKQWWIKAPTSLFFNSYPVHRTGGGRGKGMSIRLLAAGLPVLIFPEGTRSRDGEMKHFKPGAAALCVGQDVPCVPIALIGTNEAMPVGRSWPVPGRLPVRMLVGRPMRPLPGERVRDFNRRVEARIATMLTMQTPYVLADGPQDAGSPDLAAREDAPQHNAQEEAS
ncbi:1-acyl-sn-glycerol-3-phosphate acyltransferase [Georgenia yuyongxinii]|uniref:1-acyl-sn-glycerol-3-phosphate acyltransferase n=2 Tax=Georgenia yuyongxinii TaxID=2589797 RepID=A0A552WRN0_9MICO|nr:1-acyl-sn-glycerol-3-phosphate acyltransferase [Georgenia yuyongxinii]